VWFLCVWFCVSQRTCVLSLASNIKRVSMWRHKEREAAAARERVSDWVDKCWPADVVVHSQQVIRHSLHCEFMDQWRDGVKAAVYDQQLWTIFAYTLHTHTHTDTHTHTHTHRHTHRHTHTHTYTHTRLLHVRIQNNTAMPQHQLTREIHNVITVSYKYIKSSLAVLYIYGRQSITWNVYISSYLCDVFTMCFYNLARPGQQLLKPSQLAIVCERCSAPPTAMLKVY